MKLWFKRKKFKIGFGPILEPENMIGVRKYRADGIADFLNKHSEKYEGQIFFDYSKIDQFDCIVIVRGHYDPIYPDLEGFFRILRTAKNKKIKILYDNLDNNWFFKKTRPRNLGDEEFRIFVDLMDGFILSSPLYEEELKTNKPKRLIEHPILNHVVKNSYRKKGAPLVVLWQGYVENSDLTRGLHALIESLVQETGVEIRLVYHTNCEPKSEGVVQYVPWRLENWEQTLADADIGISIKPLENAYQQRKPSNKVLSYMAAGLPVVCTPSPADKLVIEHAKTGFFAHSEEEWRKYLKLLIENDGLREEIGRRAQDYARENFNLEKIGQKYESFLDQILLNKKKEKVFL